MKKENTIIIEIMKDFLYYGYTFKNFLDMNYPITKNKSIDELKNCGKKQ
jgi:hypothetical protein